MISYNPFFGAGSLKPIGSDCSLSPHSSQGSGMQMTCVQTANYVAVDLLRERFVVRGFLHGLRGFNTAAAPVIQLSVMGSCSRLIFEQHSAA